MQLNIIPATDVPLEKNWNCDAGPEIISVFKYAVEQLTPENPTVVLKLGSNWNIPVLKRIVPLLGKTIGELIEQNAEGSTSVAVYERDRSFNMYDGARYHQTRQGGMLHTDNVNSPKTLDYLVFSCLQPAVIGGESVIVSAKELVTVLRKRCPDVLATLERPDWQWDMRGVSDKTYTAPVIDYDTDGNPTIRYLRPYMEGAYKNAGIEMTDEQVIAMDMIDALTESSELQVVYQLERGDVFISLDNYALHGRRAFCDPLNAVDIESDYTTAPLKRTMQRIWVTKGNSSV